MTETVTQFLRNSMSHLQDLLQTFPSYSTQKWRIKPSEWVFSSVCVCVFVCVHLFVCVSNCSEISRYDQCDGRPSRRRAAADACRTDRSALVTLMQTNTETLGNRLMILYEVFQHLSVQPMIRHTLHLPLLAQHKPSAEPSRTSVHPHVFM